MRAKHRCVRGQTSGDEHGLGTPHSGNTDSIGGAGRGAPRRNKECWEQWVGRECALYCDAHQRFVRINAHGALRAGRQCECGPLPRGWEWERFHIQDAGDDQVSLYNKAHQAYVCTSECGILGAIVLACGGDRFSFEVRGESCAFYSNMHQGYVRMEAGGELTASSVGGTAEGSDRSSWEAFRILPVDGARPQHPRPDNLAEGLKAGTLVSLVCPGLQRCILINQAGHLGTAGMLGAGDGDEEWEGTVFKVGSAGDGRISLLGAASGLFLQVGFNGPVTLSSYTAGGELPAHCEWERFHAIRREGDLFDLCSSASRRLIRVDRGGAVVAYDTDTGGARDLGDGWSLTCASPPFGCRLDFARHLGACSSGPHCQVGTRIDAKRMRTENASIAKGNRMVRQRLGQQAWTAAVAELCQEEGPNCTAEAPTLFIANTEAGHPWREVHGSHHLHLRNGTLACCRCGRRSATRVRLLREECPGFVALGSRANLKRWLAGGDFDASEAKRQAQQGPTQLNA